MSCNSQLVSRDFFLQSFTNSITGTHIVCINNWNVANLVTKWLIENEPSSIRNVSQSSSEHMGFESRTIYESIRFHSLCDIMKQLGTRGTKAMQLFDSTIQISS